MRSIRRRLACVAALWLCCQLALVAAPLALDCCSPTSAAAVEDDACCKGMAPGQMCPMHKHRSGTGHGSNQQTHGSRAKTDCAMKGTCLPSDAALLSLSTGAGLLPSTFTLQDQPLTSPVPELLIAAQTHVEWPDSPPPRS